MGSVHRFRKMHRRPLRGLRSALGTRLLPALALLGVALGAYSVAGDQPSSLPRVHSYGGGNTSSTTVHRSVGSGDCNIKGNISVETGERIFHVPGQRYYGETVINRLKGERWFCSEAEARAAGWRKAKV